MKKLIKLLPFAALVLSLAACVSNTTRPGSAPIASKVLSSPADDVQYFYALGEGENESAQSNDALAKIAARIAVTIDATTQTNLSVTTYQGKEVVDDSFKRQVSSRSKDIEFVGVEIIEKSSHASVVRVDRAVLARHYQNKLSRAHDQLESELTSLAKVSLFEQLKQQANLQNQAANILADLSIMQSIQPGFGAGRYGEISLQTQKTLQEQKQQAVIKIESDKNSAALSKVLEQALTAEGYRFGAAANITIKLATSASLMQVKTTDARLAKMTMAQRASTIQVFDNNQKLVGQKNLNTRGLSPVDFAAAVQDPAAYNREIAGKTFVEFINQ